MFRSMSHFAKVVTLAAIGLFVAVETCQAQVGIHVGGGGGRGGGTRWGVNIGTPYYGNYYGGYGGVPYYQPYGYSYGPTYYDPAPINGYMMPNTSSYQSFYPPDYGSNPGYQSQTDNSATLQVIVPPNAELWFDGNKTQQTGSVRNFTTPALTDGKTASYEVRATWTDQSGNPVTRTRTIHVAPNQHTVVNLMEAGRQENAPQLPAPQNKKDGN